MKWICKIIGHTGWPSFFTELMPPVWATSEERQEFYQKLGKRKCKVCGRSPVDVL